MTRHLPDQPPPTEGEGPALWDVLISREEAAHPDSPLLPLMRDRHSIGVERYGRPLRAHDGRDHSVDALQEALDGMVYTEGERAAAVRCYGLNPHELALAAEHLRAAALAMNAWRQRRERLRRERR